MLLYYIIYGEIVMHCQNVLISTMVRRAPQNVSLGDAMEGSGCSSGGW